MRREELKKLVEEELQRAQGRPGSEISTERDTALDFYLAKELGNEVVGQSAVVTHDVADVIDSTMPSILRTLTQQDNLVNFTPTDHADDPIAQQQSDWVNYVFFKQNEAYPILYQWIFDALVQKNGIIKVYWDESEKTSEEEYSGLTLDQLALLEADPELSPKEADSTMQIMDDGTVLELFDVVYIRTVKTGRIRIDNVPPEEYRISSDASSLDPSSARMVAHVRDMTRSELIEMGWSRTKVKNLPTHSDKASESRNSSRLDHEEERPSAAATNDPSQDKIEVSECFIRVDADGDGISELRRIVIAGEDIFENEVVDRQPFHVICPIPLPHKHFGLSLADKVIDIQMINSTLTRLTLDNAYHSIRPGYIYNSRLGKENTMDELTAVEIGRVVEVKGTPGEAIQPLTIPFNGAATFEMLAYFDKLKRDRTSISADSEALSPEVLKHVQPTTVSQALDVGRAKIETIIRNFAETGFKTAFLHINELSMKHQSIPDMIKLRGDWVPIDPAEWKDRQNITVNVGLGIGSREANSLQLERIFEKQAQIVAQQGLGGLVSADNVFNTLAEMVKNAGGNMEPARFFTKMDPQQANQGDQAQDQLMQMQMQLAQAQIENDQQELIIKKQKAEIDALEKFGKNQIEMEKLALQREKIANDFEIDSEKIANELVKIEATTGRDVSPNI